MVSQAFLRFMGEAVTPEVEEAWAAAYGLLAHVMKEAAAEVTQQVVLAA